MSLPLDRDDEQRHTSPGAPGVYEGTEPPELRKWRSEATIAPSGAGPGRVFAAGKYGKAKRPQGDNRGAAPP